MILTTIVIALAVSAAPKPDSPGVKPEAKSGRAAIDAALERLYPKQKPFRFRIQPAEGEADAPLVEVVAYRSADPVPHWHYVGFGLSELDDKVSDDKKLSGFGVEYSLRLVNPSEKPPRWPIDFLKYLAEETWRTKAPFDPGHSADLPKGYLDDFSGGVEGLVFFEDEQLKTIDTANGKVTFVDAVPLMGGELPLIASWDAFKLADEIKAVQGGDLLWRHGRVSVLEGPNAAAIRAKVDKEGSSRAGLFLDDLQCGPKQVVLDGVALEAFDNFLRHRLAHGRPANLMYGDKHAELKAGPWKITSSKEGCVLQVPAAEARALADELSRAADKATVKRAGGVSFLIDRAH